VLLIKVLLRITTPQAFPKRMGMLKYAADAVKKINT